MNNKDKVIGVRSIVRPKDLPPGKYDCKLIRARVFDTRCGKILFRRYERVQDEKH